MKLVMCLVAGFALSLTTLSSQMMKEKRSRSYQSDARSSKNLVPKAGFSNFLGLEIR